MAIQRQSAKAQILILMDEPDLAATLARFLGALGYAPHVLPSGNDALRLVDAERPDLILADVSLPGSVGGLDLLRHVRTRGDRVPVILCTGRAADLPRRQALAAGAADYLTKPFSLAELRATVERVLGGPRPGEPATGS